MSATQDLIAAALRLTALAERNTDDRDEWQHSISEVREMCARAMVEPDMAEVRPGMSGWKGATIAWEVCASIHREYAKKKDPFFTTRQADFVKHAACARAMVQPVCQQQDGPPEDWQDAPPGNVGHYPMSAPDMAEVERLVDAFSAACNPVTGGLRHITKFKPLGQHIVESQATRTALLDYVRGVMAERDALIHDNERSIYGDAREAAGYARGLAEAGKDAERYRWLRAYKIKHNGHCMALTGPILWEENLDDAIDAALRGEVKP